MFNVCAPCSQGSFTDALVQTHVLSSPALSASCPLVQGEEGRGLRCKEDVSTDLGSVACYSTTTDMPFNSVFSK